MSAQRGSISADAAPPDSVGVEKSSEPPLPRCSQPIRFHGRPVDRGLTTRFVWTCWYSGVMDGIPQLGLPPRLFVIGDANGPPEAAHDLQVVLAESGTRKTLVTRGECRPGFGEPGVEVQIEDGRDRWVALLDP